MKIAAHNGADTLGGQEIWTVRLLQGLQARGHDVLLFVRDRGMQRLVEERGVPARVSRLGGHLVLPHALRFARDLREWGPDALILTTFKKAWLGGMAARMSSVPRVVGRVGLSTDLPSRSWMYRVAYSRWINRTAVNADGIRKSFVRALPGVDGGRVVTIYDGVPRPELTRSPGSLRRELGIPAGAPVVGTLARLVEQKRIDRMLWVIAMLPPGVHCVIAGEGGLREGLVARARDLDIAHRVHFLGFRRHVGDVLNALDLYLVTSDREGMSNAMLEAMSVGLPVVSTPVSGAVEALEPLPGGGRPGWVTQPSVEAIASRVGRVLADGRGRTEAGERARIRWASRFSYAAMLDAWEELLDGAPGTQLHQGESRLRGPARSTMIPRTVLEPTAG